MRLVELLRERGLTGGEMRRALERGRVRLLGVPTADLNREIEDPADIEVLEQAPRLQPGRDLIFLRQVGGLLVVWKPAGLLSVPAPGRREASVLNEVRRSFGEALAVHRLDQGTSGLMMVALDTRTQGAIKDLLEAHEVRREYLALVAGAFPEETWTARSDLVRDRGDGLRGSSVLPNSPILRRPERDKPPRYGQDARLSITHFRRVGNPTPKVTLMEASLETGRTHQVRIHLAELGAPILGDPLYAPQAVSRQGPRLALHARTLSLLHPLTGEQVTVNTALPDDLERFRRDLVERYERSQSREPRGDRPDGDRSPSEGPAGEPRSAPPKRERKVKKDQKKRDRARRAKRKG
ncbi:MAG: RluA family pseudouridine synthase [Deltaproteobacteria bacterium]|nr:RluA family pseudouridine synthase [Deltaproteobacteria bacterium]